MSNVVDERVVSMQFDNRHFEKNVQTSMGTLDKLKKSLNLPGASKGLDDVGRAAKRVDMLGLGNAVETVRVRFSALQVMAVTALSNITNSAVNAGKNLVKAFTIDPIKTGLQEYETQIGAVQTILANTQSKGTTLDQVNAALDELNAYADKTIYNFTEMTRNIGTFTAAGTDLETSVNAIQGIANLAAVSGSTSQQASTAMYQLSQALASGTVKLMDWNSVVNAGMGGQVFQDALKETARVHGVAIDEIIEKNGSFRDSLHEEWLTSEILTETLMKFTMATEGLTDAQIEQNKAMLKSMGYSDEQIKGIFELGNTATNAATKVKTFTQLMDTLKEAAQSGWAQTWRLLIGDFEEAKTLWTGVSDTLSEIINKSSERRNKVLGGALTSNWDKLVDKINKAGIETTKFEDTVKSIAKDNGYDVDKLIEKYGSLGDAFKEGAIKSDILKKAVEELNVTSDFDFSKVTRELKNGISGDDVREIEKALMSLGYSLTGKDDGKFYGDDGYFGTLTRDAIKAFQEAEGLEVTGIVDEKTLKALEKATSKTGDLTDNIDNLIDGVDQLGGRDLLIKAFGNAWEAISKPMKKIGAAWREVFGTIDSKDIYKFIEGFESFTASLIPSGDQLLKIKRIFKGVFSAVDIVASVVGGALKFAFDIFGKVVKAVSGPLLTFGEHVGDALTKFRLWLKDGDKINNWFEKNKKKVEAWLDTFLETPAIKENLDKLKTAFSKLGIAFGGKFEGFGKRWSSFVERLKAMDGISLENIKTALIDFKDNVLGPLWKNEDGTTIFDGIIESVKNLWNSVTGFLGPVGDTFANFGEGLKKFGEFVKNNIPAIVAILMGFMVLKTVNKVIDVFRGLFDGFDGIADMLQDVGKSVQKFLNAKAFEARAEGIFTIAKAIAVLAASVALLSFLDQGKMWSSVGAITVLIVALTGMTIAIGNMASSIPDTGKVMTMMLSMAAVLMAVAIAAKILGGMELGDLAKGVGAIAIFMGMMVGIMAATKLLNEDLPAFEKMMIGLGAALLIFAVAAKILGSMDTESYVKGVLGCVAFLGMMLLMMKTSKLLDKDLPSFGKTMMALAGTLLLFGIAMKMIGKMDPETYIRGLLGLIPFLGIMAIVMASTKLIGANAASASKVGVMMIGFAAALLLISASIAMLGHMDEDALFKGMIAVSAILTVMGLLVASTKLIGANAGEAMKVGVMMLAFSGALLILSGAIYILSGIKPSALTNAVVAISVLSVIFGALVVLTRFAGTAKGTMGTLITLTVAIGVLAASVAVLTMIEPSKLWNATGALSLIIGMFALLTASTKFIGVQTLGTIAVLTLAVGALGGILYMLSGIPADVALGVGAALSALILSLSASCLILAAVGATGPAALIGVGVLAALLAVVGLFAAIAVASLPAIGTAFSDFMTNLQPFLEGAKQITPEVADGLTALSDAMMTLTTAGFLNAITFGAPMRSLSKSLQPLGKALGDFATEINKVPDFDATKIESAATAAQALAGVSISLSDGIGLIDWIAGIGDLSTFGGTLKGFGEGLAEFNTAIGTDTFNTDNITAAATAAQALAGISISLSEGTSFMDWITGVGDLSVFGSSLKSFGEGLGAFNSSIGEDSFDIAKIEAAAAAAQSLANISISMSEGTGFLDWIAGTSDLSVFGTRLEQFGLSLSAFNGTVSESSFDVAKIEAAAAAAQALANVSISMSGGTTFMDWLSGNTNLASFGSQLSGFASGLVAFNAAITGEGVDIDLDAIDIATQAAAKLTGVAMSKAGGTSFMDWLSGATNLSKFGGQLKNFASGLVAFNDTITGEGVDINLDAIDIAAKAATKLTGVAMSKAGGTSFMDWLAGATNLDKFGGQLGGFAAGIVAFNEEISGETFDDTKIGSAISAAEKLASLSGTVGENSAGWDWLTGKDNLSDFGTNLDNLGSGLAKLSSHVTGEGFSIDTINSVITAISSLVGIGETIGGENFGSLSGLGGEIMSLGQGVGNFYVSISSIDSEHLLSVASAIKKLASIDVDNAGTLQSFIDSLGNVGVDGVLAFTDALDDGASDALASAANLMDNAIEGVSSKSKPLSSAFKSAVNDSVEVVENYHDDFTSAGGYLVEGFAAGISAKMYMATAAAAAMALAAKLAAEAALGIASPSKAFYKIGGFAGQGLVNALYDYESKVYGASEEMANYATKGFSRAIAKVSDIINNGVDSQPTIRPVLDLSEVAAGANSIGGMFDMQPSVGVMSNVSAINSMMSRRQNGTNGDVVSAIKDLASKMDKPSVNNNYSVNGVTYDDGSNISEAIGTLVRAITVEGRT